MNMIEYMQEAIKETLDDCGEKLSEKCIKDIAESVVCYYENKELAFGIIPARKSVPLEDVQRGQKVLEQRIAELEAREKIYIHNICLRRHCEPQEVVIEGDTVMIYK